MTAWGSIETAVELVKEGASDYIEKPWDDEKLVATLRNLVRMRELEIENSQLRDELRHTREELEQRFDLRGLVYASEAMHQVVQLAVNVAESDAPVPITGPNGCGKERLAEIIQANSTRRDQPFVRVNVGAIPEELMESELFGAEPGAYTGLRKLRSGRFESADRGTLFLDEIDSLSLAGQVKLLRVLQSGEFQRLGSSRTRKADVRVLSATNTDLGEAIEAGRFREDLFFRLNVVELQLPGLVARRDDVLPLARHFLELFGRDIDSSSRPEGLSPAAEDALVAYDWPGNVRELENRVRRATLVARGEPIQPAHLDLAGDTPFVPRLSDDDARERRELVAVLSRADGIVARAAEELGVSRQALYRKMARLGVELERRPRPRG
jgi:DNA-binding NtrC family response regulator